MDQYSLAPVGQYTLAHLHGNLVFSAGMTPRDEAGLLARGRVGEDLTVTQAKDLAFHAAKRALQAATLAAENRAQTVESVVSLTVYIAAGPDFVEHSAVADGASAAIARLESSQPLPTRAAVGVSSLPGGSPIEVQLIATTGHRTRPPET
ncbi:RidA family protein [Pseudonocardia hispaniensis]|uniref:RidA family protein n=1 Tax=Pseudonocardia hispaniensis TaxID=904933 RepID=A0ABW1IX90_9PSEU